MSVSAIAREAGLSDGEFAAVFETKTALLHAIFDDSWKPVSLRIEDIVVASLSVREATPAILSTIIRILKNDRALAKLLLLEGRRQSPLGRGQKAFMNLLTGIARRGQDDGSFSDRIPPAAIVAALVGGIEAMARERLLAELQCRPEPFSEHQMRAVFDAVLKALAPGIGLPG